MQISKDHPDQSNYMIKIADFGLMSIRDISNNENNQKSLHPNAPKKIAQRPLPTGSYPRTIDIKSDKIFHPGYSSPELEGSITVEGEVSKLSDVFTFGIVVLELITHQKGFKNLIEYDQILSSYSQLHNPEELQSANFLLGEKIHGFLKEYRPDIDPRFENALKICMQVSPNERNDAIMGVLQSIELILGSSIEKYGRTDTHKPSIPEILFYGVRGLSLRTLNFKTDSVIDFNKATRIPCNSIPDHSNKGRIYFELENYEDSIREYDVILKLILII